MQRVHGSLVWGFLGLAGFVFTGCNPAPKPAEKTGEHSHDHGDGSGHGHGDHAHDDHGDHAHEHGKGHDHAHNEDKLPETYAAGVTQLLDLQAKMRDAFAKNDNDTADGPVHEFGHVLESIVPLAEKANLSAEDLAAVKTAVDQLFEDMDKVDLKIHGKEGVTYAEVETKVDEALATLKKHVPAE